MAAQLFGAIDVGSYEIGLTVSEFSKKNGIRVIDRVSHRINLGTDTFRTGKISPEHVEELKQLLLEYRHICEGYGVKTYRACGTSAIREMVTSRPSAQRASPWCWMPSSSRPVSISNASPTRSSVFSTTSRSRPGARASCGL